MPKTYSEKIKFIRDKYNLSQNIFGKKIGITGKTVSAYETGRCIPPLKVLEKISDTFDEPILKIRTEKKTKLIENLQSIKKYLIDLEKVLESEL